MHLNAYRFTCIPTKTHHTYIHIHTKYTDLVAFTLKYTYHIEKIYLHSAALIGQHLHTVIQLRTSTQQLGICMYTLHKLLIQVNVWTTWKSTNVDLNDFTGHVVLIGKLMVTEHDACINWIVSWCLQNLAKVRRIVKSTAGCGRAFISIPCRGGRHHGTH